MEEKKRAMDIRTVRQICAYVEESRSDPPSGGSHPSETYAKKGRNHSGIRHYPDRHGPENIVRSLRQGVSGVKPLRRDDLLAPFIHSQVFGTVDYPIPFDFKRVNRKTMALSVTMPARWQRRSWRPPALEQEFITSGPLGVASGPPAALRYSGTITGSSTAPTGRVSPPSGRWTTSSPWSTPRR